MEQSFSDAMFEAARRASVQAEAQAKYIATMGMADPRTLREIAYLNRLLRALHACQRASYSA